MSVMMVVSVSMDVMVAMAVVMIVGVPVVMIVSVPVVMIVGVPVVMIVGVPVVMIVGMPMIVRMVLVRFMIMVVVIMAVRWVFPVVVRIGWPAGSGAMAVTVSGGMMAMSVKVNGVLTACVIGLGKHVRFRQRTEARIVDSLLSIRVNHPHFTVIRASTNPAHGNNLLSAETTRLRRRREAEAVSFSSRIWRKVG